jgi:DedD protein
MGLLSFFRRRRSAAGAVAGVDPGDDIAAARTRARRRLMGAAVLLAIGVIGFPLLFETQPRPIPVDIPIEIPRRDTTPGLAMPAAKPPQAPASEMPAVAREAPATVELPSPAKEAGTTATAAPAEPKREAAAPVPPPPKPVTEAPRTAPSADSARAKALLEGKAPVRAQSSKKANDTNAAGRYVVQVGAFADAAAAREVRSKVEKLGLKTYTQVVRTSSGNRIRVRAGPFASRDEADKALAKAKAAGMPAVVLTL